MVRLLSLVLLLASLASGVAAQSAIYADPGGSVQTREDLERLLAMYEEAMRSTAYSGAVKQDAEESAARIRARLRDGDFRVGDRVVLYVEGESSLPDTVAVESGPMISLPLFGDISLAGVLRSEIQDHLTEVLAAFIRDPVVRANGLMRLSVQGQVGSPGFFVVPAEMLVSEALMVAGGPTSSADLGALRIERGAERLLEGEELQEAMREGRTLDQLNLRAGDQIVLPERRPGVWGAIGRAALVAIPTVLLGTRIF